MTLRQLLPKLSHWWFVRMPKVLPSTVEPVNVPKAGVATVGSECGKERLLLVGIDAQILQTYSRQRGMGIYTHSLLDHLTEMGCDDYRLFLNSARQIPRLPFNSASTGGVDYLRPANAPEFLEVNQYLQRLAYEAHDLDLLHVASAMESDVVDC